MTGLMEFIKKSKPEFIKVAQRSGTELNFETECRFAAQQLAKNDKTIEIANKNRASLFNSIVNVSAIGISLNPANAHAYLVPRDSAICLDISYRGMIKLATDTGVIKWARAQLVYGNDTFIYHGPAKEPEFQSDPFAKDKGEFKGGYCIAKTIDGDILTEVMSADEINQVKKTSKSAGSRYSPWNTFEDEMRKKTIIKRAYKTWPQSDGRERLDRAVEVLNEHEGIETEQESFFDNKQYDEFSKLVKNELAFEVYCFYQSLDIEQRTAIMGAYLNTAPKGMKGNWKKMVNDLLDDGYVHVSNAAQDLDQMALNEDIQGIEQAMMEMEDREYEMVFNQLNPNAQAWIKQNLKKAA